MAEFLLSLHFLFILYMIAGFPVGLKTNRRTFRLIHAGLLAGVTLLMLLGLPCPLTILEEHYRAGTYGDSFLAAWLRRIIYLEGVDAKTILVMDTAFAVLVFSSFFWRPLKKK